MMQIIKAELDKNCAKPCPFCLHARKDHDHQKGCTALTMTSGIEHECLCYSEDGRTNPVPPRED